MNLLAKIWLGGALATAFFIGLIYVVLWSLACLIVGIFNKNKLWGVLAGFLFAAYLLLPQIADPYVLSLQMNAVEKLEVRNQPIDLTGKTILFAEESDYHDVGCRRVCSEIARHSGAKQVLFGVNRSVVKFETKYALNLNEMELYVYPDLIEGTYPISTKPVRAKPEKIDYFVVRSAPKAQREKIREVIGTYGMGTPYIYLDYHIVAVKDQSAVRVFDEKPLLSLIRFSRNRIGFPFVPGLAIGDPYRLEEPGLQGRGLDKNSRSVLEFLCGLKMRDGQKACLESIDSRAPY